MVIIRKAEPKDAKEIKQVHVSAYQKKLSWIFAR